MKAIAFTMNFILLCIAIFGLASCDFFSQKKGAPQSNEESGAAVDAEILSSDDGIVKAVVSANSSQSQVINSTEDSGISGSSVVFPPGALGVNTTIVMEEGADMSSDAEARELGIDSDNNIELSSKPVVVQPESGEEVELKAPMQIFISVPERASLLQGSIPKENLIILYKKITPSGIVMGFLNHTDFTIENGKIKFSTLHFGSYQAIALKEPIERQAEIKASAPIVTKQQQETTKNATSSDSDSSTKQPVQPVLVDASVRIDFEKASNFGAFVNAGLDGTSAAKIKLGNKLSEHGMSDFSGFQYNGISPSGSGGSMTLDLSDSTHGGLIVSDDIHPFDAAFLMHQESFESASGSGAGVLGSSKSFDSDSAGAAHVVPGSSFNVSMQNQQKTLVSGWFKPTGFSNSVLFEMKFASGYHFYLKSDSTLNLLKLYWNMNHSDQAANLAPLSKLFLSSWNHIAFVFHFSEPSSGMGNPSLYIEWLINGESIGESEYVNPTTFSQSLDLSSAAFYVGGSSSAYYPSIFIDELLIFTQPPDSFSELNIGLMNQLFHSQSAGRYGIARSKTLVAPGYENTAGGIGSDATSVSASSISWDGLKAAVNVPVGISIGEDAFQNNDFHPVFNEFVYDAPGGTQILMADYFGFDSVDDPSDGYLYYYNAVKTDQSEFIKILNSDDPVTKGKFGDGYDSIAVGQDTLVSDAGVMDLANDFSLFFWARNFNTGSQVNLFDKTSGSNTDYDWVAMFYYNASDPTFKMSSLYSSSEVAYEANLGAGFAWDNWHFYGVTQSETAGEIKIYVDGTLWGTSSASGTNLFRSNAQNFSMTGSALFQLDELMLFHKTLSADQVKKLYSIQVQQLDLAVRPCQSYNCGSDLPWKYLGPPDSIHALAGGTQEFQWGFDSISAPYFQYQFGLGQGSLALDAGLSAAITQVQMLPLKYTSRSQFQVNQIVPYKQLRNIQLEGLGSELVRALVQLSPDSGNKWLYYTRGDWQTANSDQYSELGSSMSQTAIDKFNERFSAGNLKMRFRLDLNGTGQSNVSGIRVDVKK